MRGVLLISLMIVQVLYFIYGIWKLCEGELFIGLFNVVVNAVFFVVNIYNLKREID